MSYRRKKVDTLPRWLWFFLAMPIGLIVALLYRRRSPDLPRPARRPLRPLRYIEPDSIPLKMDPRPSAVQDRPEGNVEAGAVGPASAEKAFAPEARPARVQPLETQMQAEAEPAPGAKEIPAPSGAGKAPTPPEAPEDERPAGGDDLKAIEGIGPAIAALLSKNGLNTFQQLAAAPVERLRGILSEARLGHLANPETWPEQARLAGRGEWEQLNAFQNTLRAGRKKNK